MLVTAVFVSGKGRGATIGLAGLTAFLFCFGALFKDISIIILMPSLMLVLVGSRLRTLYETSETARFLGGLAGLALVVTTIILAISAFSSSDMGILSMGIPGSFKFLAILTIIVCIICCTGFVTAGGLAVVNLGDLSNSQAIASYSFMAGLLATILMVGYLLILPIITLVVMSAGTGMRTSGGGWALFLYYRTLLILGAPIFMFGTGMYDWLKRLMPSAPK